jgi:hypothetical protein
LKDDLLIRHNDVTLFCLVTLLKTQDFVTATAVRRSHIVAVRWVILHLGEDFLRNYISNTISGYTEKRNKYKFIHKTKQKNKKQSILTILQIYIELLSRNITNIVYHNNN